MQNVYTFQDGTQLRLVTNKILVRGDKNATMTQGGLHMPDTAMENIYRTGTILAFGFEELSNGQKRPIRDLEVGLRCCFIRFLAEQHSNQIFRTKWEDDVFLIGPTDIFFVWNSSEGDPNINT